MRNFFSKVAFFCVCTFACIFTFAQTPETNSVWRQHQTSSTRSTVQTAKTSIQTQATPKAVTGPYSFSGGAGTSSDPFIIATAQDLIDMSNAVNNKLTYNGSNEYAAACYKQTADIDFSQTVDGPFIKIKMDVYDSQFMGGTQKVFSVEQIVPATLNSDGSYTCNTIYPDNVSTRTLSSKTDIKTNSISESNCEYDFEYTYYDADALPMSALFRPIGSFAMYKPTQTTLREIEKLSIAFKGTFDGDNHIISNITYPTANSCAGLFGYISNTSSQHAVVKNVAINNCHFTNPNNTYAGAVAGVVKYGDVLNCQVTNSTINGEIVGGVVGFITSSNGFLLNIASAITNYSTSVGNANNNYSANNNINGSDYAGGIVGYSSDQDGWFAHPKLGDHVKSNTINNNSINGGGTKDDYIVGNQGNTGVNNNLTTQSSSDNNTIIIPSSGKTPADMIKDILNGKVPDFCYINSGNVLDPNVLVQKAMLNRLEEELNGTSPITQNLVLPDVASIQAVYNSLASGVNVTSLCQQAYANSVRWGNASPQGTSPTDYLDPCTAFGCTGTALNRYVKSGNNFVQNSTGNIAGDYYFKVGNTYYYYDYTIINNNITAYFTDIEANDPNAATLRTQSSHKFNYLYLTWDGYPQQVQTDLKNEMQAAVGSNTAAITADYSKYYKLASTYGTATKPVVVDVSMGGGVIDNGNQLNGKQIKLKTVLSLKQWNLVGITAIESMGDGFNGEAMDNKVNYLSNTELKNDFAAIDYDYTENSWSPTNTHPYLSASKGLTYGQGFFVWPYETFHPNDNTSDWDYTNTTTANTILYQQGTLKTHTNQAQIDNIIKSYTTSLKNKGNAVNSARWFALANPFTADMTAANILASLGTVQGDCLYTYTLDNTNNATWATKKGNDIIPASKGFMVGIAASGTETQMQNYISSDNLVGIDYKPMIISPYNKSTKATKANAQANYFTFATYDHTQMGLSQMSASVSEEGNDEFDTNDAFALLSSAEKHNAEAFFMVGNKNIWHNQFKTLPHDYLIGFNSQVESDIDFSVGMHPKDIDAYLIDFETKEVIAKLTPTFDTITPDSIICTSGEIAKLHLTQGLNLYKYAVRFCKAGSNVALPNNPQSQQADISIWNNNREINILGNNLKKVEVFNALGQKVYEEQIFGNSHSFTLNTIQGAYIIKAYDQQKMSKTAKITITK
mgnify:FL=1